MAYGMRKRGRINSRRMSRRSFGRKKAVPVPKRRKTSRTYVRKNALAVNRNARAIRGIKRALHGPVQKNIQLSRYENSDVAFRPTDTRPICVDITDFTSSTTSDLTPATGCRFYQYSTASPAILSTVGGWEKTNFNLNPYWNGQNSDVPDGGSYLPLACHLTIKVDGGPNRLQNTRVRFDLISLKAGKVTPPQLAFQDMAMPQGLRWFENLADPEKNAICRDYFKIYKTKFVTLDSQTQYIGAPGPSTAILGHTSTTKNFKYVSFHIHPKKARHQKVTTGFSNPGVSIPDGDFGYLNVPQDEPLWLIMSTSDPVDTINNQVFVTMKRTCVWRDAVGSSTV